MKLGGTILRLGIALLGIILCAIIVLRSDSSYTFDQSNEALGGTISTAIVLSVAVLVLIVALMVIFGLAHVLQNISRSKGAIIGLIGFLAVLGLSYALSGDEVLRAYGTDVTASTSKWIGAGIAMTVLIAAILIALILLGEVRRLFR